MLKVRTLASEITTASKVKKGKAQRKRQNCWVSAVSNYHQNIQIQFRKPKILTGVATQGCNASAYVSEYAFLSSNDGDNWGPILPSSGASGSGLDNIQLFKGNRNGDRVHTNKFETPIIAQFIRINPTRWEDRIAMRVELYGCDYVAETLSFNGTSMVWKNLTYYPIQSRQDTIKFRFRTSDSNGILLYSRGTQGDYLALQIVENRMILNINLGSGIMTSMSAGSLLDDSIWHDVSILRQLNVVSFVVDRVEVKEAVKGDFQQLDLDRILYIGAVPHIQEGELKEPSWDIGERFYKNQTLHQCADSTITPVTFLSLRSYVKLRGYEGVKSLNVSLEFRTYESAGLLMHHKFLNANSYIKLYLEKGKIMTEVQTDKTPKLNLDNFPEPVNDGLWHHAVVTVGTNLVTLTLDDVVVETVRLINVDTGGFYYFGGGLPETSGFIGCMRQIAIDGNYRLPGNWKKDEEMCCQDDPIILNACQMTDRCSPNPCEHGGICKQNSEEFECDCDATGYTGSVCHTSLHPVSCQSHRNLHGSNQRTNIKIDPDGSGPLESFYVSCQYYQNGATETIIHHKHDSGPTTVNGYDKPGSFIQEISYDGSLTQIEGVLNRSSSCEQFIRFECQSSKLFNTPVSETSPFLPNSWWVSRRNQPMDYWGDSIPSSRKCECGIHNNCVVPDKWCNCDSGLDSWLGDEGYIREMEYLPVRRLHIGDTGTPFDDKMAKFTLGPLICRGDALYDNVATFRLADAALQFPLTDLGHSWDIYFEFKTTTSNAVMLHSVGKGGDFIKVNLIGGDQLQFQVESGSGVIGNTVETSNKLNDNEWHTVHIEKNRKQARLVVDGAFTSSVVQPPGQVRAIELDNKKGLYLGATVERRSGYVGCIRALTVNGIMMDIEKALETNTYGVGPGCHGKCDSGPCLNNGTCYEGYDHYTCDCRFTGFKGPICADEIGVNMQSTMMVKYDFLGSYKSTIAEKIRVGFTTTEPRGFLLGVFSNITGEYLTLAVSNSGHLRLVFDFGFERQEIIFPDQNFATGQYHDVQISRQDSGTKLVMKVDNFEPKIVHFNVKTSADAQFNNIQYLYIGRNESISDGFVGCISRVEFDDIYPLKIYFQENRPRNIRSEPESLTEDFCGVEPVTHPPELVEAAPLPEIDEEVLRKVYRNTTSAILGGILGIIFLAIVIMALLIGRYLSKHKGEYLTQEDEGAYGATDPNTAVMDGVTGHHVTKKKEWFI
ncbi:unnamed protein product [Allacma fusca]|uniref:Neurexin-4 n=1 Tax=Allacma fusca TaxID=39272 RepID=A0A8J2KUP8_9HEXA|nr:unnamed protein product [Allacma fusca]